MCACVRPSMSVPFIPFSNKSHAHTISCDGLHWIVCYEFEISWPLLAHHSRSCSWTSLLPQKRRKKREGDGFTGVEERGYWGGQDLILITLDRHECFSIFHHLQKDKQRKQRHSLKIGKKRRESSKHNYYIISPRVIIKAIIIIIYTYIHPHAHTHAYTGKSM